MLARMLYRADVAGFRLEKGPRTVIVNVRVELPVAVIYPQGRPMDADDVPQTGDDREVFEALGVEDQVGIVR